MVDNKVSLLSIDDNYECGDLYQKVIQILNFNNFFDSLFIEILD